MLTFSLGGAAAWVDPAAPAGERPPPALGETSVFARIPDPGQPEGILVDGDAVHVSGAAVVSGFPDDWPLWTFDRRTGAATKTETVPRSGGGPAMGLAGLARTRRGACTSST